MKTAMIIIFATLISLNSYSSDQCAEWKNHGVTSVTTWSTLILAKAFPMTTYKKSFNIPVELQCSAMEDVVGTAKLIDLYFTNSYNAQRLVPKEKAIATLAEAIDRQDALCVFTELVSKHYKFQ